MSNYNGSHNDFGHSVTAGVGARVKFSVGGLVVVMIVAEVITVKPFDAGTSPLCPKCFKMNTRIYRPFDVIPS